jgi:hypothetical protein
MWTHDFRVNGEWHVYGTAAEWGITYLDTTNQRGYAHVIFRLLLKRRYKFYIMNIVLPCVMLSVLIMIGFCLPPDAGEKDLARHLSSVGVHRFPADDCRKHPENIVGHSANWLEFRQGFMTVGRRLTCNSLAKRTVENFSDDETKMRDVGLFNLCSALVIHIIRNDRRDAILSFENQS